MGIRRTCGNYFKFMFIIIHDLYGWLSVYKYTPNQAPTSRYRIVRPHLFFLICFGEFFNTFFILTGDKPVQFRPLQTFRIEVAILHDHHARTGRSPEEKISKSRYNATFLVEDSYSFSNWCTCISHWIPLLSIGCPNKPQTIHINHFGSHSGTSV